MAYQIYENTTILMCSLAATAKMRNESVEKIYKELLSMCVRFLQYQSKYSQKTESEQYDLRPIRNQMILQLYREFREVNHYFGHDIFTFDMPEELRPFERGRRINEAVKNIIDVTRYLMTDEVRQKLRECI